MSHDAAPPPMPGFPPPPPPPPAPVRRGPANAVVIGSAVAVVAAVVATGVVVAGGGGGEAKPAPTVTVTETVDGAGAVPGEEPTPTAGETGDDSYGFGDTVAYENDVEVSLSGFARGVSGEYAVPEKTPYATFTIKIVNNSGTTLDASGMTVNCAYGDQGREGEAIYDDGFDGLPDTRILAGRSLSVPWACELPKGEKFLQVEVAPDLESETAIFTGHVK